MPTQNNQNIQNNGRWKLAATALSVIVLIGGICVSWGSAQARLNSHDRRIDRLSSAYSQLRQDYAELDRKVERALVLLETISKDLDDLKRQGAGGVEERE